MISQLLAISLTMQTMHKDIEYVPGGGASRSLDLYVPAWKPKAPVVVYIHGGAFMYGDKVSPLLPKWVLQKGYALASLNYRLSGQAIFPAAVIDCKAAVRFLRANAAKYGLDTAKVVAWGESAGAYLATMLGVAAGRKEFEDGPNLKFSSAVQGVIDLYGPTDFLQMDSHAAPGGQKHSTPDSPESKFLGVTITDNPELVAKANPITYVGKQSPPFFIAHGDNDHIVAHYQSELLVEALKKHGVPYTFRTLRGSDHGFRDLSKDEAKALDEAVAQFMRKVFGK
jgi:acetyl esterase/lipase